MYSRSKSMEKLRERSGNVKSTDPLVSFLYLIMRDHVQPGEVEDAVMSSIHLKDSIFTNGYLANYAKDIANRLSQEDYLEEHDVNRHLNRPSGH